MRFVTWLLTYAAGLAVAAQLLDGIRFNGPSAGQAEIQDKILPLFVVALARPELADKRPSDRDTLALTAGPFDLPGGEEDWTVAEAIGHDAAARAGLVMAAGLAAAGRWPDEAPGVVPFPAQVAGVGPGRSAARRRLRPACRPGWPARPRDPYVSQRTSEP